VKKGCNNDLSPLSWSRTKDMKRKAKESRGAGRTRDTTSACQPASTHSHTAREHGEEQQIGM
jgi:hypothetical protein